MTLMDNDKSTIEDNSNSSKIDESHSILPNPKTSTEQIHLVSAFTWGHRMTAGWGLSCLLALHHLLCHLLHRRCRVALCSLLQILNPLLYIVSSSGGRLRCLALCMEGWEVPWWVVWPLLRAGDCWESVISRWCLLLRTGLKFYRGRLSAPSLKWW